MHASIIVVLFLVSLSSSLAQSTPERLQFIQPDTNYTVIFSTASTAQAYGIYLPWNTASFTITFTASDTIVVLGKLGSWPGKSEYLSWDGYVPSLAQISDSTAATQTLYQEFNATVSYLTYGYHGTEFPTGSYVYFEPAKSGTNPVNGTFSVHIELCPSYQIAAELPSNCANYTQVETPFSQSATAMDAEPYYKFYLMDVGDSIPRVTVTLSNFSANFSGNFTVMGRYGSAGTHNNYYASYSSAPGASSLSAKFDNPPPGRFVITVKCMSGCIGNNFDIAITKQYCDSTELASNEGGACVNVLHKTVYSAPMSGAVPIAPNKWVNFGLCMRFLTDASCTVTLDKQDTGGSSVYFRKGAWPSTTYNDTVFTNDAVIRFTPEDFYVPENLYYLWYYLGFRNPSATTQATWHIDVVCTIVDPSPTPTPSPSPIPSPSRTPSVSSTPLPSVLPGATRSPSPQPLLPWNALQTLEWMGPDETYNYTCTIDYYGPLIAFFIPSNASSITVSYWSDEIGALIGKLGTWPINSEEYFNYGTLYVVSLEEVRDIALTQNAISSIELSANTNTTPALWVSGSTQSEFIPGSYIYFSSLCSMNGAKGSIQIHVKYCPEGEIAAETPSKCVAYQSVTTPFSATGVPVASEPDYKFYVIEVPENASGVEVIVSNSPANFTILGRIGSAGTLEYYYDQISGQSPRIWFANPPAGRFVVTVRCDYHCEGTFDVEINTRTCPENIASDENGNCMFPLYVAHYLDVIGEPTTITVPRWNYEEADNNINANWTFIGIHFGPMAINHCNATLTRVSGYAFDFVFFRRLAWPTLNKFDWQFLDSDTIVLGPEDMYVQDDIKYYLGFYNPQWSQESVWRLGLTCGYPAASPSATPSVTPVVTPVLSPVGSRTPSPGSDTLSEGTSIWVAWILVALTLGLATII